MTRAQIELRAACIAADIADRAMDAACLAAGFKSRWDWNRRKHDAPTVEAAYQVKIAAGERLHRAFTALRESERVAA